MAVAVAQPKQGPTEERSVAVLTVLPTWGNLGGQARGVPVDREFLDAFRHPRSVLETVPKMEVDTQLSGLMRGTTLPIRRYVWGLDANGAPPEMVAAAARDFNLQRIEDAWREYQSPELPTTPIGRTKHRFSFDEHAAAALKAPRFGHYFFEQVGEIGEDGRAWGANQDLFWHPVKLAPIDPRTIGQIFAARNGDLISIKQTVGIQAPELPADTLVAYVFDKDPGDWYGKSMFRSCYREWLAKDVLIRVDVENHRKAGGVLLNEAAPGATPKEIQALSDMAAALTVGGGGAVPAGTNPVFIRASGSDVIDSVNRHDEAMAREFLMMFMALGTSSSGGNRALAGSFIDWFAISQESIAIWFRDVFNDDVLTDWADLNYGVTEYVPRLVFRRPEAASPLDTLAQAVTATPGDPGGLAVPAPGGDANVTATRAGGQFGAVHVADEDRELILEAHRDYQQWAAPARTRRVRAAMPAAAMPLALPDRPLRRQPYDHEVRAQVNFAQIDANWTSQQTSLTGAWQPIRQQQIDDLAQQVEAAGGDLEQLASVAATSMGADTIEARLKAMAQLGAGEAVAEAIRQGKTGATYPVLDALESQLTARSAALARLLAASLSQAAATKAVQLSGGAIAAADVAAQVRDYLDGLSDAYLNDQFGGALSAAQNAGRMAAMGENDASGWYASELLDVNTCENCAAIDGTEYATADDAAADYPSGGYFDCDGGPRCRGTVIAVYDEAVTSA